MTDPDFRKMPSASMSFSISWQTSMRNLERQNNELLPNAPFVTEYSGLI